MLTDQTVVTPQDRRNHPNQPHPPRSPTKATKAPTSPRATPPADRIPPADPKSARKPVPIPHRWSKSRILARVQISKTGHPRRRRRPPVSIGCENRFPQHKNCPESPPNTNRRITQRQPRTTNVADAGGALRGASTQQNASTGSDAYNGFRLGKTITSTRQIPAKHQNREARQTSRRDNTPAGR